ncbi:MAG: tetratricopeptide repeat protein [Cyclobacteriaceae bacterium]
MKKNEIIIEVEELLRSARIFRNESRLDEAIRELHIALELCEKFKVSKEKARPLSLLANIQHDLGNNNASLESYRDALSIAENESKPKQIAHITRRIADVERELGSLKESLSHYQKALKYYRANVPASLNTANALRGLALLKEKMVDYSDAKKLWKEAKTLYEKLKIEDGVKECLNRLKRPEFS